MSTATSSSTESKIVPWSNLGKSGLKISQFILGCMSFGSKEWAPWVEDDEEKVFGILKKAYDAGIRTFDTADVYSNGHSEILLGKFLKKYNIKRDKVVIMTKLFAPVDEYMGPGFNFLKLSGLPEADKVGFVNSQGLSRKHIMDAVEASMKRLGTYIDVYQIHRFDPDTPLEETMRGLNDVVEKGYTRYIGASWMKAVQFAEMQHIADKNGWHKFINMQSKYNLIDREDESEMNYYCDKHGVGLTPFFALAHGTLARPLKSKKDDMTLRESSMASLFRPLTLEDSDDPAFSADVDIVKRVEEIAGKKGVKMSCVALAWLVAKGAHPIVGVGSESRLDDLIDAAFVTLTEDEIKHLEEPYKAKARLSGR